MTSPRWPTRPLPTWAASPAKVAGAFTLKNCINRGNLTAAVERDIAGIAVAGDNNAVFDGCENYGNITVVANHKTDKWRPIVAGIVAIENDKVTTITNMHLQVHDRCDALPGDQHRSGLCLPENLGKGCRRYEDRMRRGIQNQLRGNDNQNHDKRVKPNKNTIRL